MADTENKPNGTIEENGPVTKYNPDDPESQKQMWRPPDIDQDMKEMERQKRVDMIMNSQVLREELERIIESLISEGYLPANLAALQQVTELLLPNRRSSGLRSGQCVIPINDIRGVDGIRYTKQERLLRCKLAAVYRLIDLYGWSENIYNHVTVRVNQDLEHFLLNPFGLQYPEVTASSLLKVDMQGNVVDAGSTSFSFNRAGFALHSAVHSARPDIRCVIHIHHPPVVAVSAMKTGLLYVSQESALLGDVSYHDYQGIVVDTQERELIARDLGPVNKVMILRNHGVIVCGESVEEALFYLQNLVVACEAQVRLMPIGLDNIQVMSDDAKQKVRSLITTHHDVTGKPDSSDEDKEAQLKKFKVWDLEFEAQMRMLDNAGFRTGYLYRYPLIRVELPRQKNDVEVPPTATSFAQYFDEDKWLRVDEMGKPSNTKPAARKRMKKQKAKAKKARTTLDAENIQKLVMPKDVHKDEIVTLVVSYIPRTARFKCNMHEKFLKVYSDVASYFKITDDFQLTFEKRVIPEDATPNSIGLHNHAILECVPDRIINHHRQVDDVLNADNIVVINFQSNDSKFKKYFAVSKFVKMEKVMKMYSESSNIPITDFTFKLDGYKIQGMDTPASLEIETGFCIDVFVSSPVAGPSHISDIVFPEAGPSHISDIVFPEAGLSRRNNVIISDDWDSDDSDIVEVD